jgi:hypothetical protein
MFKRSALKLILISSFISSVLHADEINQFSKVPAAALTFDAEVNMTNFTKVQEAKIMVAVELIKKVIASEEFRQRVINHHYQGERKFKDNLGLTNEQIYQKILDGSEIMNPGKNNRMDVELEVYTSSTTTIGYTYPHTSRIWMNTKYFNRYNPVQVADNLFHEWMHKLGFDHEVKYSKTRKYSVPYAIGYLVEELAAKYYKEP